MRRFLDIGTLGGATGVDVDGYQRFGVVDNNGAAGRQVDLTGKGGFDLVFDLETREQRHVVAVTLDAADIGRHHRAHEGTRLLEDLVGVDQDFADIRLEVVADGTDDQRAFEVDQEGAGSAVGQPLRWRSTVAAGSSSPTAVLQPGGRWRRCGRSGSCLAAPATGP